MAEEVSGFDRILFHVAMEQITIDIPYVEAQNAYIMRRILNADGAVVAAGQPTPGDRWYVCLEVQHAGDGSEATALYRVWRDNDELRALLVTVK
jgi:hypothetical protein